MLRSVAARVVAYMLSVGKCRSAMPAAVAIQAAATRAGTSDAMAARRGAALRARVDTRALVLLSRVRRVCGRAAYRAPARRLCEWRFSVRSYALFVVAAELPSFRR